MLRAWIQRCPSCDLAAPDLAEERDDPRIVRSEVYRAMASRTDLPELAVSFLCWSVVAQAEGRLAQAGWACVHAAWACDDARNDRAAGECRERAVPLLRSAMRARPIPSADEVLRRVIVDLLRRQGRMEEASEACEAALAVSPEDAALVLERHLISEGDSGSHAETEPIRFRAEGEGREGGALGIDALGLLEGCAVCGDRFEGSDSGRCRRCGRWIHLRCMEAGMCRGGCPA
jgi:tetratricopeptide (TPR) repeat protein